MSGPRRDPRCSLRRSGARARDEGVQGDWRWLVSAEMRKSGTGQVLFGTSHEPPGDIRVGVTRDWLREPREQSTRECNFGIVHEGVVSKPRSPGVCTQSERGLTGYTPKRQV